MSEITVAAPATIANLVCGFDVMGLAINEPCDTFTVKLSNAKGISLKHTDGFNLPTDNAKNISAVALQALLDACPDVNGFEVVCHKVIKPGSGIGSSASSAAGVVVAANYLLNQRFDKKALVDFALAGEYIASGARHADNIAPCIYGGITLIRSHKPLDIIALTPPPLAVTVLHPQIEVRTADARKILKPHVSMQQAITQWANVGALVAGILQSNYELMGRALQDVIVEPMRKILIPQFDTVKDACMQAGAIGGGISGAGPAMFMLSKTEKEAKQIELAMQHVYNKTDIAYRTHVTSINMNGVRVISNT
ncbi:MAG: homoserine kinase [Bacteroidia bacterium]|nr:homoserine kinase [Bacteroidia bacterium]